MNNFVQEHLTFSNHVPYIYIYIYIFFFLYRLCYILNPIYYISMLDHNYARKNIYCIDIIFFYLNESISKDKRRLFLLSEGVKNISNQLTIGTEICAEHPELRAVAQAQGWWSGEEDFSFSAVFSPDNPPARMEMAKQRYMGGTALLQQHSGTFALLCHHDWGVSLCLQQKTSVLYWDFWNVHLKCFGYSKMQSYILTLAAIRSYVILKSVFIKICWILPSTV